MLDGLLGRGGFSSKCKSLIKPTRTRIEVLRRRAEAKQRFLKEDLAKLLANGLDVNAYGRTEEFIAGLNLLSCYSFIDQSCEYILKQLSTMQKLGQCPEECRETVGSLMFAAARFSDLPELRDLRDVYQERYGNGLECFVNQVFVEKIASKPPVMEKRIKLLEDIAAEFSIQWDSKGFKQRMDNPSTLAQEQAKKLGPASVNDDKHKLPNGNNVFRKNNHRPKERTQHAHEGSTLHNNGNNILHKELLDIPFMGREEKPSKERTERSHKAQMPHNDGNNILRKEINIPFMGREEKHSKERTEQSHKAQMLLNDGNNILRKEMLDIPCMGREEKRSKERTEQAQKAQTLHNDSNNANVRRKEVSHIPFMAREEKHENKHEGHTSNASENNGSKRPELLYNGKSESILNGNRKVQEEEAIRSNPLPPPYVKKSNIPPPYSKPKEPDRIHNKQPDDIIPLPKPRSIRRKHSKSSSSHDDVGSSEDAHIVRRISSSRRKERKGLQILFDDEHYHKDKEEKMMDKLLLHYSKKPSAYDIGKLRKKKSCRSNTKYDDAEMIVPPTRSISLPHEQSGESEPKKVYVRANSFQPDNQATHVHPKLPDYDDLAARFAALRGQ